MPLNTPRGYTYPLYSDPADFPADIQNFAQDVDVDVAALVASQATALAAPSARVSATANQSIAVSTNVFATFATEDYDNAAMANLGVNNDRITFTSTGLYLIHAEANFVQNGNATTNGRRIVIFTNLGNEIAWESRRGAQSMDTEVSLIMPYNVAVVGDFVRMQVRHNSGAAVNISARSLSATKVAG